MVKKTKLILGAIFIAAGVGLYIWNKNKDKDDAVAPTCNEGEVPCTNNTSICYNPNARYSKDPCIAAVKLNEDVNIDIPTGAEGGLPINKK